MEIDIADFVLQTQPPQFGPVVVRCFQSFGKVHRAGIKLRLFSRRELGGPLRTPRILEDQDLEIVFGNGHLLHCGEQRRFAACQLRQYLSSLEWRLRTGSDLRFDISQTLAREIQVCQLVLLIAQCKHEFPVSLLHPRNHVDSALPEVGVRLIDSLSGDANLTTVVVD